MIAIVTGSKSFIGSAVITALRDRGVEVVPLRHSFEEEPSLLPASADLWLHFAWAGQGPKGRVDKDIQSYNMEMSMAALRKASELSVRRFVFAGSQAEYGPGRKGTSRREDSPLRPVSEYGRAKSAFAGLAREWVRSFNEDGGELSFLHLRIFSVYGGGDRADSLISSALRSFSEGRDMELSDCSQLWNYMYIRDAAEAISHLSLLPFGALPEYEAVNVASGDTRSLRSYIEELRAITGSSSGLCFGTRSQNAEGACDLDPDISRLRSLGFTESYSFPEGIREMLSEITYR